MLPIILVHGIVATDRLPPEFFWGRIPETLRKRGFPVFFGGTDAVGTYQTNAAQLFETIQRVCRQTASSKVILMAHSKGGIDSRYCLSVYDKGKNVAALVTVGTPHHGSVLADLIAQRFPPSSRAVRRLSKTVARLFPDRLPSPIEALVGLTSNEMETFNRDFLNVPGVYYRSYYTVLQSLFDDWPLAASYKLLQSRVGPNDGVVSAFSARWGEDPQEIRGVSGGISHLEILDLKRRKISGLVIPDVWVDLALKITSSL